MSDPSPEKPDQPKPRFIQLRDLLDDDKPLGLDDLLDEAVALAARRHDAYQNGTPLGPGLGFSSKLSRELCGCVPPGVTIVHGPPGSAKTALVNQWAATAGCPALIVTCEMSPIVLLQRQTARVTKTPVSKFNRGEIAPDLCRSLMRQTIKTMPDLAILDGTLAPVTPKDILNAAIKTRGKADHLLIIVDSLHSWVRRSGTLATNVNEYTATSLAVSNLQQIDAYLKCSIITVSEQNRSNMGTDRQEAGADSRVIEYGAEVVIALSRDPKIKEDGEGEVPITATLAKNRVGSAGTTVDLRFCGQLMAFREGDGSINVVASARIGAKKLTSSAGRHNGKTAA